MYEVYLERRAEKDLRRLPKEEFRKVISVIKSLLGEVHSSRFVVRGSKSEIEGVGCMCLPSETGGEI